jgi:hypothetical protein
MSIDQGKSGYPEEQPSEVVVDDDSTPPSEDAKAPDADRAPHNDDGTATGNPGAAGAGASE